MVRTAAEIADVCSLSLARGVGGPPWQTSMTRTRMSAERMTMCPAERRGGVAPVTDHLLEGAAPRVMREMTGALGSRRAATPARRNNVTLPRRRAGANRESGE